MKTKKVKVKKTAAAPYSAAKAQPKKKAVNPLIEKRPKNFGIGMLYSMTTVNVCEMKFT